MRNLEEKIVDLYQKDIDPFETVGEIIETIKEELKLNLEPYFSRNTSIGAIYNDTFSSFNQIEGEKILDRFEELRYWKLRKFLFWKKLLKWVENVIDVWCWNWLFSIYYLEKYRPKSIKRIELVDYSEAILLLYILLILQKYITDEEIFQIYVDKWFEFKYGFYKSNDLKKILAVLRRYKDNFRFYFKDLEKFYYYRNLDNNKPDKTLLFAIRVINNLRFLDNIIYLPFDIKTRFLDFFTDLSREIFIFDVNVVYDFPEEIVKAFELYSEIHWDFKFKAKIVENWKRKWIYLYAFRR